MAPVIPRGQRFYPSSFHAPEADEGAESLAKRFFPPKPMDWKPTFDPKSVAGQKRKGNAPPSPDKTPRKRAGSSSQKVAGSTTKITEMVVRVPARRRPARRAGGTRRPMVRGKRTGMKRRRDARGRFARAPRRAVATPGNPSGGFFARRATYDPWKKYMTAGVIETKETGGTCFQSVATNPVYVGHTTMGATNVVTELIWKSIIKKMLIKAGIDVPNFTLVNDPENQIAGVNYTFGLFYRNITTATISTQFFAKTPTDTWDFIADQFAVFWANNILANPNAILSYMSLSYGSNAVFSVPLARMNLANTKIHIKAKSDLKVQNISLADSETDLADSENVARVPLYGKMYHGKGTGVVHTISNSRVALAGVNGTALLASPQSGMMAAAPSSALYWWQEPPTPTALIGVNKSSKAHLDPGQLKTSSLTTAMVIDINKYYSQVKRQSTLVGPFVENGGSERQIHGKFAILALERMITYDALLNAKPRISFEHNYRIGVFVSSRNDNVTFESLSSVTGVTGSS